MILQTEGFTSSNKKTKAGGIIAIVIFSILMIAPNIAFYLQNEFKKMDIFQLVLFIAIQLIFVVLLFVQYHEGSKCNITNNCNENYDIGKYNEPSRVYKLFTEGGWSNFQRWYAALASNVWQDLLFTMIIFCFPFPFLPEDKLSRFELFLAKLGLYKLSLAFILGSPNYVISDYKPKKMNDYEKGEMSIVIILLVIFIIYICFDLLQNFKNKKTKKK